MKDIYSELKMDGTGGTMGDDPSGTTTPPPSGEDMDMDDEDMDES